MKNKEYYFKHDYNPTNDAKIICLLGNYGGLGYGIFWRVIEMLHQEKEYKLPLKKYIYEAIAKQMLTNAEQIEAIINECINTYELFVSDGIFFWSNRVLDNIKRQEEISNIRSFAGKAGAFAKQNVAKRQSKVNKRKEKKRKSLPPVGDKEFNSSEYINEMIKDKKKHISLIGEYFKMTKTEFPNKKAAQAEIRRWVRDATVIAEYSREQLDDTTDYVIKKFPDMWNLSTIRKYINNSRIYEN